MPARGSTGVFSWRWPWRWAAVVLVGGTRGEEAVLEKEAKTNGLTVGR